MTDRINVRMLALELLTEITEDGVYSHLALRGALEKYQYLEKRERAFLTRLTEGTLERLLEIDYVIGQFSRTPVEKMKPFIRNLLRMSVYQLKYMDGVPDSAVCNEAVKLARKKGFAGLTGFVNGVLRNIARGLPDLTYPDLSVEFSTPAWIVEQWSRDYGAEKARRMLAAQFDERPVSIRVNQTRITKEQLRERLQKEGASVQDVEDMDCALAVSGYDRLEALPSFQEGLFQVQDVSAMRAAVLAAPRQGDACLDVCAAPGGKCLHLAEQMNGTGTVEARDLTDYKVTLIRDNIARSGMKNVRAVQMDATVFDPASEGRWDVVLADLPCSGLGVLNRKRDLKYRMSPEQQRELAALQRQILAVAQRYVKPGGTLVYSTCTVNPQENEDNVEWFLENHPFALKEQILTLPGVDGWNWDGSYMAKLEKVL